MKYMCIYMCIYTHDLFPIACCLLWMLSEANFEIDVSEQVAAFERQSGEEKASALVKNPSFNRNQAQQAIQ